MHEFNEPMQNKKGTEKIRKNDLPEDVCKYDIALQHLGFLFCCEIESYNVAQAGLEFMVNPSNGQQVLGLQAHTEATLCSVLKSRKTIYYKSNQKSH